MKVAVKREDLERRALIWVVVLAGRSTLEWGAMKRSYLSKVVLSVHCAICQTATTLSAVKSSELRSTASFHNNSSYPGDDACGFPSFHDIKLLETSLRTSELHFLSIIFGSLWLGVAMMVWPSFDLVSSTIVYFDRYGSKSDRMISVGVVNHWILVMLSILTVYQVYFGLIAS
jgi:hypothetical protein